MLDLLFAGATLVLGALALAYARGCASLMPEDSDER